MTTPGGIESGEQKMVSFLKAGNMIGLYTLGYRLVAYSTIYQLVSTGRSSMN